MSCVSVKAPGEAGPGWGGGTFPPLTLRPWSRCNHHSVFFSRVRCRSKSRVGSRARPKGIRGLGVFSGRRGIWSDSCRGPGASR